MADRVLVLRAVEDDITEAMLGALREQLRVRQGRNRQPSAGIIDSRSVKGADTVARDSRGYDAGKRINGRKRFIVADTLRSAHRCGRAGRRRSGS
jgi:hypothetical protein